MPNLLQVSIVTLKARLESVQIWAWAGNARKGQKD